MPKEDFEKITLEHAKWIMWNNVIDLGKGHRRMVAIVDEWGGKDYDDGGGMEMGHYTLYTPQNYLEPYDLILTLGTDGHTYPVYDWDRRTQPEVNETSQIMYVPSSHNWHAYENRKMSWSVYVERHRAMLPDNRAYVMMNEHKGWAGLRPPWEHKYYDGEWETFSASNKRHWLNFNMEGFKQPPPDTQGKSLAELFEEV